MGLSGKNWTKTGQCPIFVQHVLNCCQTFVQLLKHGPPCTTPQRSTRVLLGYPGARKVWEKIVFKIWQLGCRKWGCNKWGFKGCMASRPGHRLKSACFALFLPFSPSPGRPERHLENPENGGKGLYFADILWFSGKKKAHEHKFFRPVGLGTTPGLSRGFHRVCPWDKPGENLGQTQVSPYFTQWKPSAPGLSQGQTRGRRAAQKVYVKKIMCLFRSLDLLEPTSLKPPIGGAPIQFLAPSNFLTIQLTTCVLHV